MSAEVPAMLLDEALPQWDRHEFHRVAVDSSAEELFRAFDELTWSEVPLFQALMKVRGLGRRGMTTDARVVDWFFESGFVELARTDDEILIVSVPPAVPGRPEATPPDTIAEFRTFAEPGYIRIAFDFRVVDGYLTTETRVQATDEKARRTFAVYWLVIRPFSGLIRRVWLRAIASRASKAPAAGP